MTADPRVPPGPSRRRAFEYAAAVGAVIPVTLLCAWARGLFSMADVAMVFLLGVLLVASRVSRGPSFVNVLASVAAFDFYFVEPLYTLNVADHAFLVTFAVMLIVGFTVSTMTVRIREQAEEARDRERRVSLLAAERERLAEEGAAARVAAETERTRSELLSAVSHDLRTPLASISGAAGELQEAGDALPGEERRELLETVRMEGERLGRLVDGLLELTRLESVTFRPAREWCPVEEIVGSALARLEPRLAGRAVHVGVPEEVLLVQADAVLLDHVLGNLVENALKYSPPGTPVEITARAAEGGVEVRVADRGPGLSPGEEERIFDRYRRGSAAALAPGWGLGLAISRAIVHVHGGTIDAANREGGGAVFRFRLPVPASPPSSPILPAAEGAR